MQRAELQQVDTKKRVVSRQPYAGHVLLPGSVAICDEHPLPTPITLVEPSEDMSLQPKCFTFLILERNTMKF